MNQKIRVLIAKAGLDGHDRGAKVIAAALRDAGMEVIYTGLRKTPESIVEAALQEDVHAIGISSLSGAHMTIFPKVKKLMMEKGMSDVLLFGGGIVPNSFSSLTGKMTSPSSWFCREPSLNGVPPSRPSWPMRRSVVSGCFSAGASGKIESACAT